MLRSTKGNREPGDSICHLDTGMDLQVKGTCLWLSLERKDKVVLAASLQTTH